MTQKEKLLAKLANKASDKSWTYDKLAQALEANGYVCDLKTGSHHTFRNGKGGKLTIPFRTGNLLPVYAKQARELLLP